MATELFRQVLSLGRTARGFKTLFNSLFLNTSPMATTFEHDIDNILAKHFINTMIILENYIKTSMLYSALFIAFKRSNLL